MLVDVRKIWDAAPHNAFTDLIRLGDRWLCTFREAAGHMSSDGKVRVIASARGEDWSSLALLETPSSLPDLRDPKITAMPDGRLMLTAAAARREGQTTELRMYTWFSSDGATWSAPVEVGEKNIWLWRPTWHRGRAYSVGYHIARQWFVRLYASEDGRSLETVVPRLFEESFPNEASLVFRADESCCCLLRRDGAVRTAQFGTAAPPYTEWTWRDLGRRIGGPDAICLPDGRLLAAGRLYEGETDDDARTALWWLDPQGPALEEFLRLPSGGDTSYPGLVLHDGLLWVSYYASHEGKTSIYLAKVKLPPSTKGKP